MWNCRLGYRIYSHMANWWQSPQSWSPALYNWAKETSSTSHSIIRKPISPKSPCHSIRLYSPIMVGIIWISVSKFDQLPLLIKFINEPLLFILKSSKNSKIHTRIFQRPFSSLVFCVPFAIHLRSLLSIQLYHLAKCLVLRRSLWYVSIIFKYI